jgi:hypothetical protein
MNYFKILILLISISSIDLFATSKRRKVTRRPTLPNSTSTYIRHPPLQTYEASLEQKIVYNLQEQYDLLKKFHHYQILNLINNVTIELEFMDASILAAINFIHTHCPDEPTAADDLAEYRYLRAKIYDFSISFALKLTRLHLVLCRRGINHVGQEELD